MELPSRPGLTMLVYTAPNDSPAADSLALLASWAATSEPMRSPTYTVRDISTSR
jgi:hypothetical protein